MSKIDRRTLLVATGIAAFTGTGIVVQMGGQSDLYRSILYRLIGPFSMDEAEFDKFAADFSEEHGALGEWQAKGLDLLETAPVVARLKPHLPARLEAFNRELLTQFALATGLSESPGHRKLQYGGLFGASACNNPYARFA
jgi:hypothetical protein